MSFNATYTTGSTIYAVMRLNSNGHAIIVSTGATEAFNGTHLSTYVIAFAEQGGGFYAAAIPANTPTGVTITLQFFVQADASPATTDRLLNSFAGIYDGSVWTDNGLTAQQSNALIAALSATTVTPVTLVSEDQEMEEVIVGNDYLAVDNMSFVWTGTQPYNFTGTGIWYLYSNTDTITLQKAISIVSTTSLRLELTAAQTATLSPGTYRYEIKLTLSDGSIVTPVKGYCYVVDQQEQI